MNLLHYWWWLTVVAPALEALITVNYHYWSQTNVIPQDLLPTAVEMKDKLHKNYRKGQQFSEYEFQTKFPDWLLDWFFPWTLVFQRCLSEEDHEGIWLWGLQSSCTSALQLQGLASLYLSKGAFTVMAVQSLEVSTFQCCVSRHSHYSPRPPEDKSHELYCHHSYWE